MTIDECKKVMAKIQLGDNRQVDELTLREWFDTIGHLKFEDAIEAVRLHRRESLEYLMPAHLVANVRRAIAARPTGELEADRGGLKPANFDEMVEAYRSRDPHRIAIELGKYNRQRVDAGRQRMPDWPLAEPVHA